MTPTKVLEAKKSHTAAARFAAWLREQAKKVGSDPSQVFLWSPQEAQNKGWGDGWAVCWEEGPFEWTMVSAGSSLYAGEFGDYSKPGPFPEGVGGQGWFAEPYNNFILSFYP